MWAKFKRLDPSKTDGGSYAKDLGEGSLWQNGPEFLKWPVEDWPKKSAGEVVAHARESVNKLQRKAFIVAVTANQVKGNQHLPFRGSLTLTISSQTNPMLPPSLIHVLSLHRKVLWRWKHSAACTSWSVLLPGYELLKRGWKLDRKTKSKWNLNHQHTKTHSEGTERCTQPSLSWRPSWGSFYIYNTQQVGGIQR